MNGRLAAQAAEEAMATGDAVPAGGAGAERGNGAASAGNADSTGTSGGFVHPASTGGGDVFGNPGSDTTGLASLDALRVSLEQVAGEPWPAQVQEIRERFACVVGPLGVRYFSYQLVRCPMASQAGPVTLPLHTFPADWQRVYAEHEFAADDPLLARALHSPTPFYWTELGTCEEAGAGEPFGPRRRLFLRELCGHGLGEGMTIPVHTQGEAAVLHVVPEPGQAARMRGHGHLLQLIAYYLHHKARRPMVELTLSESARRRSLLSPRETEALEWTARGKTTRETSRWLGISEKAVEFHLSSARRKLHASNRTHAVAKALVFKLLFDAA